jgi:Solitary outer membrane autotransporter beta-barrel domain
MVDTQQKSSMKTQRRLSHLFLRASLALGLIAMGLLPFSGQAQLTPAEIAAFKSGIGNRIEALTILGGDYGLASASYSPDGNNNGVNNKKTDLNISKFGGSGDIYPIHPLGETGIGWQPRLQGSMGTGDFKNHFTTGDLKNDTSEYKTFAIEFGGGARFWFNEHFSIAPTFMGMYGHTENDYTAHSAFAMANIVEATKLGLVRWNTDTWTVRPAVNMEYVYNWNRVVFTFDSDPTYFHTESFNSSNPNIGVNGDSETWENKLDIDIPLGKMLWGHEVRTGGYFGRTDLFDGIKNGLNTDHIYEIHGRIVLDFLGELWKVKWLGVGYSYLWGSNFNGYSIGVDAAFRF